MPTLMRRRIDGNGLRGDEGSASPRPGSPSSSDEAAEAVEACPGCGGTVGSHLVNGMGAQVLAGVPPAPAERWRPAFGPILAEASGTTANGIAEIVPGGDVLRPVAPSSPELARSHAELAAPAGTQGLGVVGTGGAGAQAGAHVASPPGMPTGPACVSQCTDKPAARVIIGCDDRWIFEATTDEEAKALPWGYVGRLSWDNEVDTYGRYGFTGTLIAPNLVLTAAHGVVDTTSSGAHVLRSDGPLSFELAKYRRNCAPWGRKYVTEVWVPDRWDGRGDKGDYPQMRAYDFAICKVRPWGSTAGSGKPTPIPVGMLYSHARHLRPLSIGYPYDLPADDAYEQGFRMVHSGWRNVFPWPGLHYNADGLGACVDVTNDGVGGQSGSPVFVEREKGFVLVGVLVGSPPWICQQGKNWAAFMSPTMAAAVTAPERYGSSTSHPFLRRYPVMDVRPDVPADSCT